MTFKYESIVPWGRSYDEYIEMFELTNDDLDKYILGCGDGPASFNSIHTLKGRKCISIDPIYQFTKNQIKNKIMDTFSNVIEQTRKNIEKFKWDKIKDIDELSRIRMAAMNIFLNDYEKGSKEGRYVCAELPKLPFNDNEFDLVISAHLLFFYSDNLSIEFHKNSIIEMLRVAKEVRIFPIVDINSNISKYYKEIKNWLSKYGIDSCLESVNYEFQIGGNEMLKIWRNN